MVSVDDLRRRVAVRVLGIADLTEAPEHHAFFRASGKSPVHLEFCVGTPDSRWEQSQDGRQRPERGTIATTEIHVVVSYQLAAHDQRDSGDAALQVEAAVRNRLCARDPGSELAPAWPVDLSIFWISSSRAAGAEVGWLYLESIFAVAHLLPLS